MVERINQNDAYAYLDALINSKLVYAIKSFDMDLYDFGFTRNIHSSEAWHQRKKDMCYIHVTCRFKIIRKTTPTSVLPFYEDTPNSEFKLAINPLIGCYVKRIALSEKNDLWLDFGPYWIVFATFESNEESWRFFSSTSIPHLVASNTTLEFVR